MVINAEMFLMKTTFSWRISICLVSIVIASFGASGCINNENSNDPSRTFVRSINSDPESLDPHKFRSVQAGTILRDIGEGLVAYGPTGDLVPGAATEWKLSDDGLTYLFNLRPDAKWSNGKPLTAADFVRSFRRLFDPRTASPSASNSDMILLAPSILRGEASPEKLAVTAVDTFTLEIRLSSPTPFFLQLLTSPSLFPIYQDASDESDNKSTNVVSISNGAYTISHRLVGSSVKLARNENYWDNENTWFDEVIYRILDPQSELLGFRAGEIDFTNSVASGSFEMMKREHADELKVAPSLTIYYYGFNLTRAPFKNNPKLRQALSMAIDREKIVELVTRRGELPAYSFVPDGITGYKSSELSYTALSTEERHEEARRLYTEAGYGPQNPARFQLRYNTMGDHQRIALAIQNLWSEILGAKVELVNEEFRVLISNIQEMKLTEAFRLSWTGDYSAPHTFLQLFITGNSNNLTGYSNPRFDKLMARAEEEIDPTMRLASLQEAEGIVLADPPVIPIYFFVNKHMLASDIVGYNPSLLDIHHSKNFHRTRSGNIY
jgi:ABC-type oligopeptide transport system substrate-binding subunit